MFIGIARFDLHLPGSGSLKGKRHILRPVVDRVRNNLNLSIAEVEYQDLWQRAALGVTCVSSSVDQCRKLLADAEKVINRAALEGAEVIDRTHHVVALDDL